MKQNMLNNQDSLRDDIDIYLSKWKIILACTVISLAIAFIYLRYATYEYQTTASIKIKSETNAAQLPEISALQNYAMLTTDRSNVDDEIEVLKSRRLIEKVVKGLKLNIEYYVKGRIIEQEVFLNPPLLLSFFESDSIINKVDTTLYVTIISPTTYKLSGSESNELVEFNDNDANKTFGDKLSTSFGDIIITPNIGTSDAKIGSTVKIEISPLKSMIEKYLSKINVQSKPLSNIISLTIVDNVKSKSELILNRLIEEYNNAAVRDKDDIIKISSEFINNRLNIITHELQDFDLTAEALKKDNRLSNLASQSSIFLQSEAENEARLTATTNQMQLIDYMGDYLSVNNKASDLLPANVGIENAVVAQVTNSHNELVLQRNRILKNSSEKNPTVINLSNQISDLKTSLNQSLQNLKASTQITLNSLNKEDERIRSQIYSAPRRERQIRDIDRQQGIKESLYLYLLEKREETAVTLGTSAPNAKIINAAYSTPQPISPKKTFIYLASLLIGLIFPIASIYLMNLLDNKIHTKDDVLKRVNAPFIGDIPRSSSKKTKRIISKIDYSPKAEAFRMIRTNIDFMMQNKTSKTAKTIFVTSTTSKEGKTHTSINLATSLSFSEKRVLLIETDIRDPKVSEYLNIKKGKGLTDFVSEKSLSLEDVIVSVNKNSFLNVIHSGTIPPNPAELLMDSRVKLLFDTVKKVYDYIIVDTSAVGLVTDALLISNFADMFIYVVSANNLDKRQLHVAQTLYDENRLPNMAILLNGTSKKSGYGYGYGYGTGPKKKKWYKLQSIKSFFFSFLA
jgi:tyrosine-protein kinase Etk/Wzc